uniref:EF-hand domain-containing protein n=1 Tax=Heterorhabditis bacteriophora TaxID=37862 RepID=A0A1I7W717_HETBA
MGQSPTEEELDAMFNAADQDHDGNIDFHGANYLYIHTSISIPIFIFLAKRDIWLNSMYHSQNPTQIAILSYDDKKKVIIYVLSAVISIERQAKTRRFYAENCLIIIISYFSILWIL